MTAMRVGCGTRDAAEVNALPGRSSSPRATKQGRMCARCRRGRRAATSARSKELGREVPRAGGQPGEIGEKPEQPVAKPWEKSPRARSNPSSTVAEHEGAPLCGVPSFLPCSTCRRRLPPSPSSGAWRSSHPRFSASSRRRAHVVRRVAPKAEERAYRGWPIRYSQGGRTVCAIQGYADHLNLLVDRAVDLRDPKRLLDGTGAGSGP